MPTVDLEMLTIAYSDRGPHDGLTVVLLHGWPDAPSTWDLIGDELTAQGHRVIVPTLRGFGDSVFLSDEAPRTGNSGILAMDVIALIDALHIGRFAVVGHDWGSNVAEALAVGWPSRIERIAMLSTPPRLGGMPTPPFWHAQRQWYHWFMATERGAEAVRADHRGFAHLHWENWSPPGWFDEATFDSVAGAWDNPDWVAVTLHSYRSRWEVEAPDPRSQWLEDKVRETATLSLPVLYVQGEEDGVNPPAASRNVADKFTGSFEYLLMPGVGHFPQREAPAQLAERLLPFLNPKQTQATT